MCQIHRQLTNSAETHNPAWPAIVDYIVNHHGVNLDIIFYFQMIFNFLSMFMVSSMVWKISFSLIRRRRYYHDQFNETHLQTQGTLWQLISDIYIYNNYDLNVMTAQCRTKRNTLVVGYENLKRLLNDNPERYQTYTPSFYDQRFHNELSDEFWYTTEFSYTTIQG